MALSSKEVLQIVRDINEKSGRRKHPLWKAMVDGTLNRAQLAYLCKQHGIIPLHNHNYHGRMYVSCPDPEWRERLAEVAYEEATGRLYADGVPHYKLYLNYAKALGISREEMFNVDYCPSALGLRLFLSDACSRFVEGVAAVMLAGEAQVPGLFGQIANTLEQKFGLDREATAYWTVHDKADEDHGDAGREILDRFVKTEAERQLVVETARQSNRIRALMFDETWNNAQALH